MPHTTPRVSWHRAAGSTVTLEDPEVEFLATVAQARDSSWYFHIETFERFLEDGHRRTRAQAKQAVEQAYYAVTGRII